MARLVGFFIRVHQKKFISCLLWRDESVGNKWWKKPNGLFFIFFFLFFSFFLLNVSRASLVAQWLRICLPMQGTLVRALVWEDPTCRGVTRPVSHNYWACASGACVPQQERPRQWEARAPRWEWPPLASTRESPHTETKTQHSQKLIN